MTRLEMVTMIKEQLGFRTTLDTTIVRYMVLAQLALEKMPDKPWFLLSEDSFTTTTIDEERVELPSDFIEEVEDATFKYRPDDYPSEREVALFKDDYDNLRRVYYPPGAEGETTEIITGAPEAYALMGNYFRIFPVPDAVYNVRMIYYKKGAALAADGDTNVWSLNAPHLLMGTTGLQLPSGVRNADMTTTFNSWIQLDSAAIRNKNVARDMANREMQVGGRHY